MKHEERTEPKFEGRIALIVIEYDNHYELIKQHDHALLAGEMAMRSGKPPFQRSSLRTVLTAALHDTSWRRSDSQFQNVPHHFVDYPMREKLELYKTGIDEMEKFDEFVALLTSIHYTAFFNPNGPDETKIFLSGEKLRQQRLRALFPNENIELAHEHLKMWDNFSLYVCLNKPGVRKEDEHPWFKKRIQAVSASGQPLTVQGKWLDESTVGFSPFPFMESWKATFPISVYDKNSQLLEQQQRAITFVEI